jgi:GR25 family glycosyltransferase involved in LPS biosynthesis
MIGATASHVKCCKEALETGKDWCLIFEDDCVLKQPVEEINRYLLILNKLSTIYNLPYDIILLGALGYTSFLENSIGVSSIYGFHGCHAVLINKKGMKEYINRYYEYLSKNYIEAPDGIYSELIHEGILVAFGPTDARRYMDQKQEGMWSYISEHLK